MARFYTVSNAPLQGALASQFSEGYTGVGPDIRFYDDFESARMDSVTTLALPSNLDGFTWAANNRTSVVKDEWDLDPSGGRAVWNNGVVSNFAAGADWRAKSGLHSLRFRYASDAVEADQYFSLGVAMPEVWISYWLRVPLNYAHTTGNQKFFALWMDSYSGGIGPIVTWEMWAEPGVSQLGVGTAYGGQPLASLQKVNLIDIANDKGRWMKIALRIKASSSIGANDGIIETWRRWNGDLSWTRLHLLENQNMSMLEGIPQGWKGGYILGWHNGAYSETTEYLVDEFTISATSLVI